MGGPHATYSTHQCVEHADVVVKADGFRNFRLLLEGKELIGRDRVFQNVFLDPERMAEGFPVPDRELVYAAYHILRDSPIKSIMCSEGCPFWCSYCYAPKFNEIYGGFALTLRPVEDVIREALEIKQRWDAKMIYFQDDIFGFRLEWLREFCRRWKAEVDIPWHCQIRLELAEGAIGDERLDLFAQGGCTGITLAIESGNPFLRQFVLNRPMEHELIVSGVRKIQQRGMTLRTEQILGVPFSDIETDLQTLALNVELRPDLAWVSILAPYEGTSMGTISKNLGFYSGNNDDLAESFFDRSVLRHTRNGIKMVSPHVLGVMKSPKDNPLSSRMVVQERDGNHFLFEGDQSLQGLVVPPEREPLCKLDFLDPAANERYSNQLVALQRLFSWFAKVPRGHELATQWVEQDWPTWSWPVLARLTQEHLDNIGLLSKRMPWRSRFAEVFRSKFAEEPSQPISSFPEFFCFIASGEDLAQKLLRTQTFQLGGLEFLNALGREVRWHLYDHELYRTVESITPPIARW